MKYRTLDPLMLDSVFYIGFVVINLNKSNHFFQSSHSQSDQSIFFLIFNIQISLHLYLGKKFLQIRVDW